MSGYIETEGAIGGIVTTKGGKTVHCFGAGLWWSYVVRKLRWRRGIKYRFTILTEHFFDHPNITMVKVNAMDVELSAFDNVDLVTTCSRGILDTTLPESYLVGNGP